MVTKKHQKTHLESMDGERKQAQKKVANALRAARKQHRISYVNGQQTTVKGLTQAFVAYLVGLPQRTYARMELTGKGIDYFLMERLIQVLGLLPENITGLPKNHATKPSGRKEWVYRDRTLPEWEGLMQYGRLPTETEMTAYMTPKARAKVELEAARKKYAAEVRKDKLIRTQRNAKDT